MATTKYGSWMAYNGRPLWRTVATYSVTDSETSAVIELVTKIEYGTAMPYWPGTLAPSVTLKTTIDGVDDSNTYSVNYQMGKTVTLNTRTVTITKTHANQSISIKSRLTNTIIGQGGASVYSEASGTQTVSAKTSYKVTFDANGGDSGSLPATQTKWHGESLTLSSAVPTRSGCTVLGWNTSKNGSGTNYDGGVTYSTNSALKLYAIWAGVQIDNIDAYRCDENGVLEDEEGAYGHLEASYTAIGTLAGSVAVTARYMDGSWQSISLTGDTSKSKSSQSSASGSVAANAFGGSLARNRTYKVQVTVTFTCTYKSSTVTKTATATAYVTYAYSTMEYFAGGRGVSFGKPAVRDGFDVAFDKIYFAVPPQHDTDVNTTTLSNFFTADGCTVSSCRAVRYGKHAYISLAYKLSTALSVPESGNVSDVTLGTLKAGWIPAVASNGIMDANYGLTGDVDTSGVVKIRGANSRGAAYTIGTTTTLYARFPLLLA